MNEDAVTDAISAEMAYERSGGYFFQDRQLEPYSNRRKRAGNSLGFRFWTLNDDEWEKFSDTMSYDGIAQDAVILIWVCLQTPEKLTWAMRFPDRAVEQMNNWADGADISPGDEHHAEAMEILTQTLVDIMVSQGSDGNEDKKKEDDGEGDGGKPSQEMPSTKSDSPKSLGPPLITSAGEFRTPEAINGSTHTTTSTVDQP